MDGTNTEGTSFHPFLSIGSKSSFKRKRKRKFSTPSIATIVIFDDLSIFILHLLLTILLLFRTLSKEEKSLRSCDLLDGMCIETKLADIRPGEEFYPYILNTRARSIHIINRARSIAIRLYFYM